MRGPVLTLKRARRLRRAMTLPETILWNCLRKERLRGLSFRRQHPLGPYILDFYQPAVKLAVEIDGAGHDQAEQIAHDAQRDAWLRAQGVTVLRFPAASVLDDELREGVLAMIAEAAALSTAFGGPPPP